MWPGSWTQLGAPVAAAFILVTTGVSIGNYFFEDRYQKDDARGLVEYINMRVRNDDVVILNDALFSPLFSYYFRASAPWTALPRYGVGYGPQTLHDLDALARRHHRLWFIHGPSPDYYDQTAVKVMDDLEARFFKADDVAFYGYGQSVAVALYLTEDPVGDELPASALRLNVPFGSQLFLVGAGSPEAPVPAGQFAPVVLYWDVQAQVTDDLGVTLRLRDDEGRTWAVADERPYRGFLPTTAWPAGRLVRHETELAVPPDVPPGVYRLALGLYHADQSPLGPMEVLTSLSVTRPSEPVDTVAVPHPLHADWGVGIRLLGYDIGPAVRSPGDVVDFSVYLQARRAPERAFDLHVDLVDEESHVWATLDVMPVNRYPTDRWQAGDVLRGQHSLIIPPGVSPGRYRLRLSLIEPDASQFVPVRYGWLPFTRRSVSLTTIQVEAHDRAFQVPPIQHPLDVRFGDSIKLLGYNLPAPQIRVDEPLEVTLYWQTETIVRQSYKATVQLLSDEGRIAGQDDAVPARWGRPTTGWLPGEVITDPHSVLVRADTSPGRYTLIVALYEKQTGLRLPLTRPEPSDHLRLQEVSVRP